MAVVARKTILTLYSAAKDLYGYDHQVRLVLAEKGVNHEEKVVSQGDQKSHEDLMQLNPYGKLPVLIDRNDLVLYEARIIMEYLDERFPYPPLLPVYPVKRAESRQLMFRIEKDWYSQVYLIVEGNPEQAEQARKQLTEALISVAPVFGNQPYFLSDEFTLVDCCIAPLLWRLPQLGVHLENFPDSKPILDYAERLFSRDTFQASLTDIDRELRAVA